MSQREAIVMDIHRLLDGQDGEVTISPTSVAADLMADYSRRKRLDPKIAYATFEHLKQLARECLRHRYDAESDEAEAYQQELFSYRLQRRYPTPHKRGEEPEYKLLELLTDEELDWNIGTLDRSAKARQLHADALRAFKAARVANPANTNTDEEAAA